MCYNTITGKGSTAATNRAAVERCEWPKRIQYRAQGPAENERKQQPRNNGRKPQSGEIIKAISREVNVMLKNECAEMTWLEFAAKYHDTLRKYPGMECAYNAHWAYRCTTTKYYKIGGKWHEAENGTSVEIVPGNYYLNTVASIPVFRGLGGSERVTMGYTCAGYIPVQVSSISPDRKEKIVRRFKPMKAEQ